MNPLWLLALVPVAILAWPLLRESLRRPMGARARRNAPGQFATLSQGVTHYRWHGDAENGDAPVAVCVHGQTTPSFVWDEVAAGLVDMGFRVLVYDLYGRGYSDRPDGVQDLAFFLRQLDDLLAHEGVSEPAMLLGYSMGGAIAAGYAARSPERVRRLVLLAPAGMVHGFGGLVDSVVRNPVRGRWLMHMLYPRMHRRGCEAERATYPGINAVVDGQLAEQRYRGWVVAIHNSLRGVIRADMKAAHEAIAKARLPVLAIWGRDDEVIPLAARDRLARWNPGVVHDVIDGAGHGLPYTHGATVVSALQRFVAARP